MTVRTVIAESKPEAEALAASTGWRHRLGALSVVSMVALMMVSPSGAAAAEAGDYSRVPVVDAGISLLVPNDWAPQVMRHKQAARLVAEVPAYREAGLTDKALLRARVRILVPVPGRPEVPRIPSFAAISADDPDGYPGRWLSVYVDDVDVDEARLTPDRWKRRLEASGFEAVKVEKTTIGRIPVLRSTATAEIETLGKSEGVKLLNKPGEVVARNEDGTWVPGQGPADLRASVTQYSFVNRDDDVISIAFYRQQPDDTEYDGMIDTMIGSVELLH